MRVCLGEEAGAFLVAAFWGQGFRREAVVEAVIFHSGSAGALGFGSVPIRAVSIGAILWGWRFGEAAHNWGGGFRGADVAI